MLNYCQAPVLTNCRQLPAVGRVRRNATASLVATLVVFAATALSAAEIRFRPHARCDHSVVRLGDVADIITVDRSERSALAAIELGPATATRQMLESRDVQERLAAQGVKLVDHQFSGARAIAVELAGERPGGRRPLSKSAANLANTAVAEAIVAHLKTTVDADEEWSVEVAMSAEQAQTVAAGNRRASATGGRDPWTGAQEFLVTVPGAAKGTALHVSADVKRAPRAVVAINQIARGETVRENDVELARIKAGSSPRASFQSLEDVVGKEAVRNIAPGQVLDTQYLRSPLLVRAGDVVDLFARSGGVQVRTKARARDAGGHGDLIDVELLGDRRKLLARVCGIQEVEILAAAPVVSK